ncbi:MULTISPECIES: sigma-54-dependent transcriptional regulator [Phyllobacteriaceae]|jgi:two-component system, NtrC family, response regulator AtoC|uniref:Sigma-54-dependent Fis family transcriptional regulator n=2 Tax=cellular organisms TaxID=131567 RepID=A0A1C2DCL1_9HYPH|nr:MULTISPECIES: sigma-54 dependent transcriptional regulator [Mesorhizobium]MBN9236805.1 sigma-54-dependent Fis family transcriptional regulator [Mesorhizobium sp.]MDQ0331088.1 DNA-binding NtrC family response regulator [Mesorhizobium sp. YL-MeA3-2017]OCX12405.1 sigma-54-dependent Fis family transcriptional regulator [Mesorhizobium hungaricum]
MPSSILVVDDEPRLAETLALALEGGGLSSDFVTDATSALQRLEQGEFGLVITDLRMPGRGGRDLLQELRRRRPDMPVVVMTAYASLRDAVALVKEGAFDYISKPFEIDDVIATARRALQLTQIVNENRRLRAELEEKYSFGNLIGSSPAFGEVLRQITEVCASRATVLIQGESGTGKELVARAIHFNSPRSDGPFIAMNCSAIPENLLESELFGHAKGAFTGAVAARDGRFVTANGGTLFLDEIGDLPLSLQPKLLRVLQDQVFEPVGSDRSVKVDVRIITATHRDLEAAMQANDFREDLYYRLAVYPIRVPSLRERAGDILPIATHFLAHFSAEMNKKITGFAPEAEAALATYQWPGNIRELQNAVERATIVAARNVVGPQDLPGYVTRTRRQPAASAALPADLDGELERIERDFILAALQETDGIQVKAAERLGIAERSLWHRIKKLGIKIAKTAK